MKEYNIIFIHGIGDAKEGYSKKMQEYIKNYFKEPTNITFYEFLWSQEITEGEKELLKDMKKLHWEKLRKWFIVHISDVIAYMRDKNIAEKIRARLRMEILNPLIKDNNYVNIIIAHSLGSVIAFDVLKGYQNHGLMADYFFSLGSPLAMFINDFQKEKIYDSPIKLNKLWLNIFSPYDIMGFNLSKLNEEWGKDFVEDIYLKFGDILKYFLPSVHSDYFKSEEVADYICKRINQIEKIIQ